MNHKKTCCVCFTSEKVHKFPQGKGPDTAERFAIWANFAALENVLDDQKCYALCEKHFERRMFINNLSARLVKPAYPTLHPPVYHGPITMDGTVVGPSIPKSETFEAIYLWKEALLLSSLPLPESVLKRLPNTFSAAMGKKSLKKVEDAKQPLLQSQPLTINNTSVIVSDPSINTDKSTDDIINRSSSPVNDSSFPEVIKIPLVVKTYSRKSQLNKKEDKISQEQVLELSPSLINPPSTKQIESEVAIFSALDDDVGAINILSTTDTTSPFFNVADRPLSPIIQSSNQSFLTAMETVDSFYNISEDSASYDISMESEFNNIVSMLTDSQQKDIDLLSATDLLSAAINNADITFNEENYFCSDTRRSKEKKE